MDPLLDEKSRAPPDILNVENLWEASLQSLPTTQQDTVRSWANHVDTFDGQQLLDAVARSRQQAESRQWKLNTKHGAISIREKFDKIAVWIRKFITVGDVVVQYDPGHAAIPWAAFRFVIMVLVNDSNRAGEFVAGVEQVGFLIYDCAIRESLYLKCAPSFLDGDNKDDLTRHLILLYSDLLRFMVAAHAFFSTSTFRRVVKSTFLNGDEVLGLLEPINRATDKVITICNRVDANRQLTILTSLSETPDRQELFQWLKARLDENSEDMQTLLEICRESRDHLENIDYKVEMLYRKVENISLNPPRHGQHGQTSVNWKRTLNVIKAANALTEVPQKSDNPKILLWLSRIPYEQHHQKMQSDMVSDTGEWFFREEAYTRWREGPESAILWFHGAPGRGKTKIMSLVIEKALKSQQQARRSLYFYCSRSSAEPERGKSEDILRCLVKQIATSHTENGDIRIPRYIAREYKRAEKKGFAISQLDAETCCKILKRFAQDCGQIFVFLDALDECEELERFGLMDTFQEIIDAIPDVAIKLLVSSRDDTDFQGSLSRECLNVELLPERNQDDICKYVEEQLALFVKQRKIRIGGKAPTPELQLLIKQKLCEGAGGMFRWVSIQLDYLRTLRTAADVRQRLGQLPRELTKSYDELYDWKIETYDEKDVNRLQLALGWMLLPDQPPAGVFAHLVYLESYEDSEFCRERNDVEDVKVGSDDEQIDRSDSQGDLDNGKVAKVDPLVQSILTLCFNLLVFDSTSDKFQFAHASVQEYLEKHRSEYTDTKLNYARLAERCMQVLTECVDIPQTYKYTGERSCKVLAKRNAVQKPAADAGMLNSAGFDENINESDIYINALTTMDRYDTVQVLGFDHNVAKDSNTAVSFDLQAVSFAEMVWSHSLMSSGDLKDQPPLQDLLSALIEHGKECSLEEANPIIFISACTVGVGELVKAWLKCHPKLACLRENSPGEDEVLCEACYGKQSEIVELLIANGAHVNSCNANFQSALSVATQVGNFAIVKRMLELGADVNSQFSDPVTFLVKEAIEKSPNLIELVARDVPPISVAASKGISSVVELLIEWGANIEAECYYGSPLMCAARASVPEQAEECMKILLEAGANVNAKDWDDRSALMIALMYGNVRGAKLLIARGADVNALSDSRGSSVLYYAVNTCTDCIPALLTAGADPNLTAKSGWTALHEPDTDLDALRFILPKFENINAQDYEGDTPLSNGVYYNLRDTVEYLLEVGAEIVPSSPGPHVPWLPKDERVEGYGQDALIRAFQKKRWKIAEILVRAGERRDPGGYYSEGARLVENGDAEAFRGWIAEHAKSSPQNDARIQQFRNRMAQRFSDFQVEACEARAKASGLQYDPEMNLPRIRISM